MSIMETSLAPLFALLIGTIIVTAITVHAVSAGDPAYGSGAKPFDMVMVITPD